jgi:adenylylsulfate kinase
MIIQFCGLSGAGKTTLAAATGEKLRKQGLPVEIIDGDEYRETICRNLGFSKKDRCENIRRLAFVAGKLSNHGIISIICAINPYEEIRKEICEAYGNAKTIYIDCPVQTLKQRDTKGLYRKAMLPEDHPDKIKNLTGINDPFDVPAHPDLYINTDRNSISNCTGILVDFILQHVFRTKIIQLEFTGLQYYQKISYR